MMPYPRRLPPIISDVTHLSNATCFYLAELEQFPDRFQVRFVLTSRRKVKSLKFDS
jgi:hypothetical protein